MKNKINNFTLHFKVLSGNFKSYYHEDFKNKVCHFIPGPGVCLSIYQQFCFRPGNQALSCRPGMVPQYNVINWVEKQSGLHHLPHQMGFHPTFIIFGSGSRSGSTCFSICICHLLDAACAGNLFSIQQIIHTQKNVSIVTRCTFCQD